MYQFLEKAVSKQSQFSTLKKVVIDRLMFTPHLLSLLYFVAIMEVKITVQLYYVWGGCGWVEQFDILLTQHTNFAVMIYISEIYFRRQTSFLLILLGTIEAYVDPIFFQNVGYILIFCLEPLKAELLLLEFCLQLY